MRRRAAPAARAASGAVPKWRASPPRSCWPTPRGRVC
jgi:hypothetical protein